VIGVPGNVRVYLACGVTDMRKGFDGLAARVQTVLQLDPHGGALFVFRGRRGDLLKVLWWTRLVPIRQAIGARPVPPMAFVNGFGRA
jgi:transposase